ncbi:hypothetical protein [Alicyclobacillus acidocaldarius]|nr:hypothetical protein [Alicyclobacillus acidocaldarius]
MQRRARRVDNPKPSFPGPVAPVRPLKFARCAAVAAGIERSRWNSFE